MKLDPIMRRGVAPDDFDEGDGVVDLHCFYCGGSEFRVVAVRSDRHCRIVCCDCSRVQTEFTAMWLGRVDGTS